MPSDKRRVLIVEPNHDAAARVAARAVELGLDPVMCEGIKARGHCPVAEGHECVKNTGCGAVLVSLDGDAQARVAPGCAGDAPMVVTRATYGPPARVVVADRHVQQPYDPAYVALVLYALADAEVAPRKRSIAGVPHLPV